MRLFVCLTALLVAAALASSLPDDWDAERCLEARKEDPSAEPCVVLCSQVHDELPLIPEWIEYHRLLGVAELVLFDDASTDGTALLQQLYEQHGRQYVTVLPAPANADGLTRQLLSSQACLDMYKERSDWIGMVDIDEFFRVNLSHLSLPRYLASQPVDTVIVYSGSTTFGKSGQERRFGWTIKSMPDTAQDSKGHPDYLAFGQTQRHLHEPLMGHPPQRHLGSGAGSALPLGTHLALTNSEGNMQLLLQSHTHRAPDERFGEAEEDLRAATDSCSRMPCDHDRRQFGKALIRSSAVAGLWIHGGRAFTPGGVEAHLANGGALGSDKCPEPACTETNPSEVHIMHYRSPSLEDQGKKNLDWSTQLLDPSDAFRQQEVNHFFELVPDESMTRHAHAVALRLLSLMK